MDEHGKWVVFIHLFRSCLGFLLGAGLAACASLAFLPSSLTYPLSGLPNPRICWLAANTSSGDDSGVSEYWVSVENWRDYPIGLFVDPSPTYNCADAPYTGRMIVQIRSAVEEYPLALYCDLVHPRQLSQLAFTMPERLTPEIFLFLWDTSSGSGWISNRIILPQGEP